MYTVLQERNNFKQSLFSSTQYVMKILIEARLWKNRKHFDIGGKIARKGNVPVTKQQRNQGCEEDFSLAV